MCDPIGGQTVWNIVKPMPEGDTTPLIVLSATMDSSAFFRDLAFGRSAYTSGLIALLAVAETYATVCPLAIRSARHQPEFTPSLRYLDREPLL